MVTWYVDIFPDNKSLKKKYSVVNSEETSEPGPHSPLCLLAFPPFALSGPMEEGGSSSKAGVHRGRGCLPHSADMKNMYVNIAHQNTCILRPESSLRVPIHKKYFTKRHTGLLVAAPFVTSPRWKLSKCLSAGEQMSKLWSVHTMGSYSAMGTNNLEPQAATVR